MSEPPPPPPPQTPRVHLPAGAPFPPRWAGATYPTDTPPFMTRLRKVWHERQLLGSKLLCMSLAICLDLLPSDAPMSNASISKWCCRQAMQRPAPQSHWGPFLHGGLNLEVQSLPYQSSEVCCVLRVVEVCPCCTKLGCSDIQVMASNCCGTGSFLATSLQMAP